MTESNIPTPISKEARVWIYQADRKLEQNEVDALRASGERFVAEWSSHGQQMEARFEVRRSRFILVMADEAKAQASGCGIDRSVHFVQDVGAQLAVDFFDRTRLCYLDEEDGVRAIALSDIPEAVAKGQLTKDTKYFDNLVATVSDLEESWLKPMSAGWTSRYFT
jgi:hypothetical protein